MGERTTTRSNTRARTAISVGILLLTLTTLGVTLAGAAPASRAHRARRPHAGVVVSPLSLSLTGVVVRGAPGAGIPLTSFHWGVASTGATRPPTVSGGVALRGHFTFEVTRPLDQYSPVLFAAAATGRRFTSGVLRITPPPGSIGPGGATAFLITFRDLAVTSDQWAGDASGAGSEAITFSFASYALESRVLKPVPTTTTTSTTTTSTTSTTTTTIHVTPTTLAPPQ